MEIARVDFVATPADYVEAGLHWSSANRTVRGSLGFVRLVYVMGGALGFCFGLLLDPPAGPLVSFWSAVTAFVGAIVLPVTRRRGARRLFHSLYSGPETQVLRGPYRVVLTDEGVEAGTDTIVTRCQWAGVSSAEVVGRHIMVTIVMSVAFAPRAAFGSDDEFEFFLKAVRERLPTRTAG